MVTLICKKSLTIFLLLLPTAPGNQFKSYGNTNILGQTEDWQPQQMCPALCSRRAAGRTMSLRHSPLQLLLLPRSTHSMWQFCGECHFHHHSSTVFPQDRHARAGTAAWERVPKCSFALSRTAQLLRGSFFGWEVEAGGYTIHNTGDWGMLSLHIANEAMKPIRNESGFACG